MSDVLIEQVDERDNSWERGQPRFRVYLHGSGESSTSGWTDTYDIVGADVLQVIDWAQRQAGDSLTYAVALVYERQSRSFLDKRNRSSRTTVCGDQPAHISLTARRHDTPTGPEPAKHEAPAAGPTPRRAPHHAP